MELGVAEPFAAAFSAWSAPASAARNVNLFFGFSNALSKACWDMLTSPSSWLADGGS